MKPLRATRTRAACVAVASVIGLTALVQPGARGVDLITEASIRGHMEFLAGDALHGRGSGTRDEWIAATYLASHLRRWGLEPLGDEGGYVQTIETPPNWLTSGSKPGRTWNVVGRLPGRDATRRGEAILLTAHLDHLGVFGDTPDNIFNGADDDASGTVAVLELVEALAAGPRPERSIIVAWFGAEEIGGYGAAHFVKAPPVPLDRIVANLEFEMIGRADPSVPRHTLWMAGYDRSTLGPALAEHGARLVADPRPDQRFFERSDNIQLAYRGVVAHTVSSFGLHGGYHQPTDDLSRIDFAHMTETIQSMLAPIAWLANATFTPAWRPDSKPVPPPADSHP
jgi:hypothetical protein